MAIMGARPCPRRRTLPSYQPSRSASAARMDKNCWVVQPQNFPETIKPWNLAENHFLWGHPIFLKNIMGSSHLNHLLDGNEAF
jgi:hypothetical protein